MIYIYVILYLAFVNTYIDECYVHIYKLKRRIVIIVYHASTVIRKIHKYSNKFVHLNI